MPQPEPNRVAAAAANFSLKASIEPNAASIAAASSAVGAPPLPCGPMTFQKSEWLKCPPPLLRTAALIASGSVATRRQISSIVSEASSGLDSSALLRFVTYA